MLSTANQAYVFLSTVYAGFIIGFIYDCYRMVRRITKPGKWVTGILDLSFWLLMGVLSFVVIFYVNDGEVRIYTIAGFAIGWILYVLVLSPIIMRVLQWIYEVVAKAIHWTVFIILWPFRAVARLLAAPARWIISRLRNAGMGIKKTLAGISLKKFMKKKKEKEEF